MRILLLYLCCSLSFPVMAAAPEPTALLKAAIEHWRGQSAYTEIKMTIHRPDWQRSLELKSWTQGRADTLVRFTAPAKDAGNATLKIGNAMWLFNPKLNRVMKLPMSMMSQSWMGSDFSYNDIAKSDQILSEYTHELVRTETEAGHQIYTIEAQPKADAPVVWGKQELKIRDDHVLLAEHFFDQDRVLVKSMTTRKIGPLGHKSAYPVIMRMTDMTETEHWTEIHIVKGHFNLDLPGYLFTQSNLRNPRPWTVP